MSTSPTVIPPSLRGLVDDAAVFPPGNAPLAEAVRLHRDHRAAPHADLVGPLVVGDAHLPDLARLLAGAEDAGGEELALGVVVSGGAGALEPAVRWVPDGARLGTLAVALRDSATGETAHNARRICTAVDRLRAAGDLDDEVAVLVEPPRLYDAAPARDWLAALDEIAAADHRLKLRTGGADADAVPSAAELATCIGAALDRELSFSCTAGLHAAVRHRDAATGQVRHGFLNVLVATRASLDGAGTDDVAAVLQETDPAVLLAAADEPGRAGARRWFRSFGSCSIAEPLSDLETLGLVPS